jgi:hypothetical protein
MSNVANLASQIAKLSRDLTAARNAGDDELAEDLEYQIADLQDELDSADDHDDNLDWI